MGKGRMEAFSDGMIGIFITIMVLEMHVPGGASLRDLAPLLPRFSAYILSFLYLAIYWNNHHHMLQAVQHVTGRVLWANMHLMFWLSLIPLATDWVGETHFAPVPTAAYGAVLLGAAIAYYILSRALVSVNGARSPLARALGDDAKGKLSIALYLAGIALAGRAPALAAAVYFGVALVWLVPDRRIERVLVD
jgi:uncharacterized membrane protein